MGDLASNYKVRLHVECRPRQRTAKVLSSLVFLLVSTCQLHCYSADSSTFPNLESQQAKLDETKIELDNNAGNSTEDERQESKILNGVVEKIESLSDEQPPALRVDANQKIYKVRGNDLGGIFRLFLGNSSFSPTIELGRGEPQLSTEEYRKMEYGVIGLNALLLMNSANPVVQTVMPGGPAETAGIRPGDLIVKAREHVFKPGEGQRVLWQLVAGRAGTAVEMTVLRGGELLKFNMLRMNIEDLPDKRARRQYEMLLSVLGAPHYDEDGDLTDSAAKDSHELRRLRVLR